MPTPPSFHPHRVVALALPGVILLDLAAPTHLFGHCGAPRYSFELAAVGPGAVATSTGFDVVARHGLEALADADTIVVPGYVGAEALDERRAGDGEAGSGSRPGAVDAGPDRVRGRSPGPETIVALREAFARGTRILSVCTGAFALAHAGLLDGRRAATHWAAAADLAGTFPNVTVDPTVLYVDEGQVLTSAGVAAGLDLCLHVIRRDHGAEVAAHAARRTVIAPHRDGGQAQFVERPIGAPATGAVRLEATRAWALERLAEPLDVATLAGHACVSARTFARRFREETGTTPTQWLLDQRTLAVRRLLEGTDLPIEEVARRCGFASSTSLRDHFSRRVRTSPTAYRRSFRTASGLDGRRRH